MAVWRFDLRSALPTVRFDGGDHENYFPSALRSVLVYAEFKHHHVCVSMRIRPRKSSPSALQFLGNTTFPGLLISLIGSLIACHHAGILDRGGQGRAERAWLRENAHAIALADKSFDDLAFLEPLLDGKRVVQLGENTHGVREYNLLKARIVRYLHQELEYNVLVFESPLYQCYDANLDAGEAPARSTLTNCSFGVWHTEEVLALFDYLRDSYQSDRPLRLSGVDVQPIGNNKAGRPAFLSGAVAAVDPGYAAEVSTLDSRFLEVYARGSKERRVYFRSEDGQRLAQEYDRLAAFLADNEAAIRASEKLDPAAPGVARQTARSMASYIRQQSAPDTRSYVERRDEGMAENLMFILDELYPNEKVIVWGHNFHLRRQNEDIQPDPSMFPDVAARTMGSWISERYGDAVYTIGLYAYEGQAVDNSGEVYEIEPAEPGSMEGLLHMGGGALFVDLSRAAGSPETAWMGEPITARYNGTIPLTMRLRNQYDAILLVGKVTPRVMLY